MRKKQNLNCSIFMVLLVCSLAFMAPIPARCEDAADYYKGKTMEFIVPYAPGGGYDTYARMLAPFMEKELSGSRSSTIKHS